MFRPLWQRCSTSGMTVRSVGFEMQIAMIAGFLTGYPINGWLISSGLKEKM